jgi:fluoride exporter
VLTLSVTLAAGAGAVARYLLDQAVTSRVRSRFPFGTFAVNVTGALLLGLVTGFALHHGLGGDAFAVLGLGFTGGYTTFSTWVWEGLALVETGDARVGAAYGVGSFLAGLAAAAAGLAIALL